MREVDAREFDALAMRAPTVFDAPAFAALNGARADRVVHLMLGEPDTRFGLVGGIRDGRLRAPFSAPWSLPLLGKARPRIRDFQRAAEDLATAGPAIGTNGIDLVLPAPHVAPDTVAKWTSALSLAGFVPLPPDISFHLDLTNGAAALDPKARQKVAAARRHKTRFVRTVGDEGFAAAYGVISRNRADHGYPLHMLSEEFLAMRPLVDVDAFVVEDEAGPGAAAICYRLSADVALVVYWGDAPETAIPHPMNLLVAELCDHYAAAGCTILDTGTASIAGEPQHGLADFKQSVGGLASLRARFASPEAASGGRP